ncbi:PQQ-binding-like beta-propeller repeat protein [bacterium]|nr:PQQ-binding-like beta-propeller repeat protein [bacterium]
MRYAVQLLYVCLIASLSLLQLPGCGGQSANPPADASAPVMANRAITLPDAVAAVKAAPAPDTIAPELWNELTSELARVIAETHVGKLATAPPSGDRNRVADLHIEQGGGEFRLVWSYVCAGDYDLNSEVNVSDLTPIGVNFGARPDWVTWGTAQRADGDRNGLVGVADITPIGQNYQARTTAYHVYASADQADYPSEAGAPNGAGAELVGTAAFTEATTGLGEQLVFNSVVETPVAGAFYWVRPTDGETDGPPSNLASETGRGDWWMQNREPTLNGRSLAFGPRANNLAWTYATGDEIYGAPVVRADGVIIIGSQDDSLHAINPDGGGLWTFPTGGNIDATPAIAPDGTLYFGGWDGSFYSLHPDGTLNWAYAPTTEAWFSPAIGPDGTIYVGCNDDSLYAIQPDMTIDWGFPTGAGIHACPAIGSDGTVYVGSYDNNVYAINGEGSQRWSFTTGGQIRCGVALGPDGTVYAGSMDQHLYAIDSAGQERWRYDAGGQIIAGPAIGADGSIYIGSRGRYLTALSPDGSVRWRFEAQDSIETSPAIGADGLVYFGDRWRTVYALNQDGSLLWTYQTNAAAASGMALGNDGTLYVGGDNGSLFAFGGGDTGTPATLDYLLPMEGTTGAEVALAVTPQGSPPFTITWNLGGGAEPNTPTGANPTVTLGPPGIYAASVTASNSYDPAATVDFQLYVHPVPSVPGDWLHSWGGSDEEGLTDLVVDSHGHIHAVGYTYTYGAGDLDVLLVEYDANGNLISARTWGTAGWDEGKAIAIDDEDNLYIAGSCEPDNLDDALLLVFDADGELAFARSWDNTHDDDTKGITLGADGTIWLGGDTRGSHPGGVYGALVLHYTASGDFISATAWDLPLDEWITDMTTDSAGNILATGTVYDYPTDVSDPFVLYFDGTGTLNWARRFDSEPDERLCFIAVDSAGNSYICGYQPSILKYDPLGNLVWSRQWSAVPYLGAGIAVRGNRLTVVGGAVDGVHYNFDPFILMGDTSGAVDWGRVLRTAFDDDIFYNVAFSSGDAINVSGQGWSNLGTWAEMSVAATDVTGTNSTITPTAATPVGTPAEVTGALQDITGIVDAPTGMANGTLARVSYPD